MVRLTNFEGTGIDKLTKWLEIYGDNTIDENTLEQVLKTVNISFILEEIDRVQSTLICELKDSYVQQSQRYVTMTKESYVLPKLDEKDTYRAVDLMDRSFDLYGRMSKVKEGDFKGRPKPENYLYGIPIEDARYILPLATKTNLCVAMSGDKLIKLFKLMKDNTYKGIFSEILEKLSALLPSGLLGLLFFRDDRSYNQELVGGYYADFFSQLTPQNNMVLIDHFGNLDLKVGLGALTSTLKDTPSQAMEHWGDNASVKAQGVVRRVLGYGHDSIAEQARTTFGMMCSLVTYHQQLRHRLSENHRESFSTLIQDEERPIVVPVTIKKSAFYQEYASLINEFKNFRVFVADKYGYGKALSFLLNCDQIKLVVSTNARIDNNMLSDRTCLNAQWEIRQLSLKKLNLLRGLSKELYEKALPSCIYGKCKEGNLTCGQQVKMREQFLV